MEDSYMTDTSATANSVAGTDATSIDDYDFDNAVVVVVDEEQPGDLLPSVEEYKASMMMKSTSMSSSSSTNNKGGVVESSLEMREFHTKPNHTNATSIGNGGDDEQGAVGHHDQLPSVEEYKASSPAVASSSKDKCQRRFFVATLIFVFLMACFLLPLIIIRSKNKNNQDTQLSNRASRSDEVMAYLEMVGVSSMDLMTTKGTPQHEAAVWIADFDKFYMDLPVMEVPTQVPTDFGHNLFVERYVLAVMYYSLGGPTWSYKMNFLKPIPACSWYQDFRTDIPDQIIRLGVNSCHPGGSYENLVKKIGLRTFW
jgi:hypothetical protein